MNATRRYLAAVGTILILACSSAGTVSADGAADDEILNDLQKAKQELTSESYRLRYKYKPGETIHHEVEQLSAIDTTIQGNNMKTQLQTKSLRAFEVRQVTDEGNMIFAHRIVRTEMWNKVSGREKLHYNSESDEKPPAEFAKVAKHIGEPISVITLSPSGRIINRENRLPHPDVGLGGLAIPFPEKPIKVGHKWSHPIEVKVKLPDQRIKVIKTRELYELKKVKTGVATISIKTQILTPVSDPRVKVQLIQRISQGEIRFDVDAGRLLSKRLDYDEQVLGFNGAESRMKYLARLTETLVDASGSDSDSPSDNQAVAAKPGDKETKVE